jgi:hypothetical protein
MPCPAGGGIISGRLGFGFAVLPLRVFRTVPGRFVLIAWLCSRGILCGMKPVCPRCRKPIPSDEIHMSSGTVHCTPCGEIFSIPELLARTTEPVDVQNLPDGVSFEEWEGGFRATASCRSLMAWFLVPFTMAWGGFSLSGIYGSQLLRGEFQLGASLFGLPFLLGSIFLTGLCLFLLFGFTSVECSGGQGRSTFGMGPFRWHRQFPSTEVTGIDFQPRAGETNASAALLLAGGRRVSVTLPNRSERAEAYLALLRHAFFGSSERDRHPLS